ncbi:MAG: hypothetical protein JSU83_17745 [Deltaproteobacteria bacterium]|nr:MAG: hypothetical protein JSU83_17745 [Deltaproteobacteria bacterium]
MKLPKVPLQRDGVSKRNCAIALSAVAELWRDKTTYALAKTNHLLSPPKNYGGQGIQAKANNIPIKTTGVISLWQKKVTPRPG